jgi:hypothetical protein
LRVVACLPSISGLNRALKIRPSPKRIAKGEKINSPNQFLYSKSPRCKIEARPHPNIAKPARAATIRTRGLFGSELNIEHDLTFAT